MWRHVKISQDAETPPSVVETGRFQIRYAYARAAESRAAQEPGQDGLAFACDDRRVAFVLCDGVSQSFFGNIAARILCDGLLSWLIDLEPDLAESVVADALGARLAEMCPSATVEVDAHPLPLLPPMVAEVLEQKRRLGSESMFVAGRVDDGKRLVLAWMGDSRLRVFTREGESSAVSAASFRTEQRWSTRRGQVHGPFNCVVLCLDAPVERVVAYSDGLLALDGTSASLSDGELSAMIESTWISPKSDDVSFIEVAFHVR